MCFRREESQSHDDSAAEYDVHFVSNFSGRSLSSVCDAATPGVHFVSNVCVTVHNCRDNVTR